jgi:hypothetical protein
MLSLLLLLASGATETAVQVADDEYPSLFIATLTLSPPPREYCDPCEDDCATAPENHPRDTPPTEFDTICITSQRQYWFLARVHEPVAGPVVPAEGALEMWFHYGPDPLPADDGKTWLVSATFGRFYFDNVWRVPVHANRRGEWYLLLDEGYVPAFLPCSLRTLREEARAADFPHGLPTRAPTPFELELAAAGRLDSVRIEDGQVVPRYAIPVSRLREHLAALGPLTHEAMMCRTSFDEELDQEPP